jgi:hypothetical protein
MVQIQGNMPPDQQQAEAQKDAAVNIGQDKKQNYRHER